MSKGSKRVFRNSRVRQVWAVVLFLGNLIAMPIYSSLYIWPEPSLPISPCITGP